MKNRRINLIFADVFPGHAGSSIASKILSKGLLENEWIVEEIHTPYLERVEHDLGSLRWRFNRLIFLFKVFVFLGEKC
ncbi:MAG: hypothetical protein HC936_00660 [Leptolyngbyaceae cyanobacterium SU_3_3]|nr:hypothetical protein [Leptolyngbyaceae cyanobacterium SU_3_3]